MTRQKRQLPQPAPKVRSQKAVAGVYTDGSVTLLRQDFPSLDDNAALTLLEGATKRRLDQNTNITSAVKAFSPLGSNDKQQRKKAGRAIDCAIFMLTQEFTTLSRRAGLSLLTSVIKLREQEARENKIFGAPAMLPE